MKCKFCEGEVDSDPKERNEEVGLCYLCYSSVPGSIVLAEAEEVLHKDLCLGIGTFRESIKRDDLFNHPNYWPAWNKLISLPTVEQKQSMEQIEALKKTRHELEAKVVELSNDNFYLRTELQNTNTNQEKHINPLKHAVSELKKLWQDAEQDFRNVTVIKDEYNKKNAELEKKVKELEAALAKERSESEQWRVKLSVCGVAAQGGTKEPVICKEGDYGWSAAYQDVLDLRRRYDACDEDRKKCCNDTVKFHDRVKELEKKVKELGNNPLIKSFVKAFVKALECPSYKELLSVHWSKEYPQETIRILKQKCNNWETKAAECRFKAEKLEQQVKNQDLEIKDLCEEIEKCNQELNIQKVATSFYRNLSVSAPRSWSYPIIDNL